MGNRFASGKNSIAECDRCDFRFKLKDLRRLVIKTKNINLLVCRSCWDPDHPQLQLGMYPVDDPQAVRNPRRDLSYFLAGTTGLQIDLGTGVSTNQTGVSTEGSRIFQWGWNPVGGASSFDTLLTPNNLIATTAVGTVTTT
jgi:hypothetical protein